jgi:hypothetical protein
MPSRTRHGNPSQVVQTDWNGGLPAATRHDTAYEMVQALRPTWLRGRGGGVILAEMHRGGATLPRPTAMQNRRARRPEMGPGHPEGPSKGRSSSGSLRTGPLPGVTQDAEDVQ